MVGDAERACSFCNKREPAVKLFAGHGVSVCNECVVGYLKTMDEGSDGDVGNAGLTREPNRQGALNLRFQGAQRRDPACSFCGRVSPRLVQSPLTLESHALICRECLAVCQGLLRTWSDLRV